MRRVQTVGVLAAAIVCRMAFASSVDDAAQLKQEATDLFRHAIGRPAKSELYNEAIAKLDAAEKLLEATPSDEPDRDEIVLRDCASLKFWAQKFSAKPAAADAPAAAPAKAAEGSVAEILPKADALQKEAAILRHDGKYDEAAAKLKEYLAVLDAAAKGSDPDNILVIDRLTAHFTNESAFNLAEVYVKQLVEETEKKTGPDDLFLTRDLERLGTIQMSLANFKGAELTFKRIVGIREKALGKEHIDLVYPYSKLVAINKNFQKWDWAESFLKLECAARVKNYKKDDPRLARNLLAYGDFYIDQAKLPKAEEAYTQALAIREKAYGTEDARLFGNLRMLAVCYMNAGKKLDDAEQLLNRALALAQKSGPESPTVATVLTNLANLYIRQHRLDDAEKFAKRAIAIREKCYGSAHVDVGFSCNVLGNILRSQGHLDLAEEQYKRTQSIFEKSYGADNRNMAIPFTNLGCIYQDQKEYAKAEDFFQRALTIIEKTLGDSNDEIARLCNNLALVFSLEKKWTQAVPMHQRAIAVAEKVCGPTSLDLANYLTNYGNTLKKLNNFNDADRLFDRAKGIRTLNDNTSK